MRYGKFALRAPACSLTDLEPSTNTVRSERPPSLRIFSSGRRAGRLNPVACESPLIISRSGVSASLMPV